MEKEKQTEKPTGNWNTHISLNLSICVKFVMETQFLTRRKRLEDRQEIGRRITKLTLPYKFALSLTKHIMFFFKGETTGQRIFEIIKTRCIV